ncbi:MAG: hypothetical protein JST02_06915 [Bacteroidetes bacterium]|nr:hypothetical protein [Bacteroidota bacterium]
MKYRLLHIILLGVAAWSSACAQKNTPGKPTTTNIAAADSSFKFLYSIPGNYVYLDVDILDNIYLITTGNQLKKLKNNGDSVAVFNDVKKYGNPSFIDVTNPLKVLVYYKNYATAVILDRLLAHRNSINFRNKNIFTVKTIATSYDNNIWIFDEQDFKLKKIDDEGKVLSESADMRLLTDNVPSPSRIIDNDNLVYLYDEQKGFYIFDYYGALKNNLPFLNWTNIAVSGNRLMGFSENKLYSYELKSLNLKTYPLPSIFSNYESIKASNGRLYLLKKDGVDVYSIQ